MPKQIPVMLGADPFCSGINQIIAAAEVDDDKIVITVERERLVHASSQVGHLQGNPLRQLDQVIGLSVNVAYKADLS